MARTGEFVIVSLAKLLFAVVVVPVPVTAMILLVLDDFRLIAWCIFYIGISLSVLSAMVVVLHCARKPIRWKTV